MSQLREHWEGVSLPGDYLLQRWLSGDDAAGFFETTLPADGRPAVVKLVLESAVDGATQLALWQRTRSLHHPNLLELLDCGRAELAGEIVVFAVFEPEPSRTWSQFRPMTPDVTFTTFACTVISLPLSAERCA